MPAVISKNQLVQVKKSWDEFKQMIGLYVKGLMYAATQCSSRKTALANKTKQNDAATTEKEDDATQQAAIKKRRREEEQAEKSTRRKIIAEAKKEAKGKATSHQGSDAWPVFTLDYKHRAEIPVHKSSDFKGDGADYNAPS